MHRRSRMTMAAGSLSLILTLLMLAGFSLLAPPAVAARSQPHPPAAIHPQDVPTATVSTGKAASVTVVVQFDDQRTVVRTVDFTQPISGLTALLDTGLAITWAESSFGQAVCAIEGVGCPADDCFCDPDRFWAYSYWDGEAWQAYPVAAGQSIISTTGAIEGWRWGEFTSKQTAATPALAAAHALAWLHSQQDATTGGYGDGLAATVEVMLALGANRERMADWKPAADGPSLAEFVRARARDYSRAGVAEAGKLAVAAAATDGCRSPRSLRPTDYYSETIGAFAPDNGMNTWAILGSVATSRTVPATAVQALAGQQFPSGGWEWQAGFGADTNTTAVAIQALLATETPVTATEIVSGLAFLKGGQLQDGGIVYDPSQPQWGADANSTAYTLMALTAAGIDAADAAWTTAEDATPLTFLLSLQDADGSFAWQAGAGPNLLATTQAVTALLGRAYPMTVRPLENCPRQAK